MCSWSSLVLQRTLCVAQRESETRELTRSRRYAGVGDVGAVGCFQADPLSAENAIMFMFIISVSIGVAMSLMLGWHIYLILTNQVTGNSTNALFVCLFCIVCLFVCLFYCFTTHAKSA